MTTAAVTSSWIILATDRCGEPGKVEVRVLSCRKRGSFAGTLEPVLRLDRAEQYPSEEEAREAAEKWVDRNRNWCTTVARLDGPGLPALPWEATP